MLLFYIKFYVQNKCHIKKTRIEVKVHIITYTNACKVVRLISNNWNNKTNNITDKNDEADINSADINLVEFDIHNNILLADNIKKP